MAAPTLIGRATAPRQPRNLVSAYRTITLTGPGGTGKTALALELARSLFPALKGDAWRVELASVSDPVQVPLAFSAWIWVARTSRPRPSPRPQGACASTASGRLSRSRRRAWPRLASLWQRANELAERPGDPDPPLRTPRGLWIDHRNPGDHRAGLQVANRFQPAASSAGGLEDTLVAERMVGMSRFVLGDPHDGRRRIEGMLARHIDDSRPSHMVRFHFEQNPLSKSPSKATVV